MRMGKSIGVNKLSNYMKKGGPKATWFSLPPAYRDVSYGN